MNVIKHGVRPDDYWWEGHCSTCGCVMEAKRKDLRDIQAGGQRDEYYFGKADCATCGLTVNFYKTDRIESAVPPREHWHD